jgi:hypothetical protein
VSIGRPVRLVLLLTVTLTGVAACAGASNRSPHQMPLPGNSLDYGGLPLVFRSRALHERLTVTPSRVVSDGRSRWLVSLALVFQRDRSPPLRDGDRLQDRYQVHGLPGALIKKCARRRIPLLHFPFRRIGLPWSARRG